MKALTIWQPWAPLIMAGAKPYEFRGWSPRLRGRSYAALIGQRIVIHSSTRRVDYREVGDIVIALHNGGEGAAATCLHADKALPVLNEALKNTYNCSLAFGCGLGTAVLGEPRNGFDIAEEFGVPRVNDSDRDEHANWGWPMLEIEPFAEPFPMKGAQGFWEWPDAERMAAT